MIWIVVFAFVVLAVILDALLKLRLKPEPAAAAEGSGLHGDPSLQPSKPELAAATATDASSEAQWSGFLSSPSSESDLLASVAEVNTEAQDNLLSSSKPETAFDAAKNTEFQASVSSVDPFPSSGYKYDVFLSFMGSDTRRGFIDFLYRALLDAGVRTYTDAEAIQIGEDIGSTISKAIAESKICIPILSKNYASSKWCLRELASILECNKQGYNMILPVFYDVTPREVRNQTGNYGRALQEHAETYNMKSVQQWREALSVAGSLKGFELDKRADGSAELMKQIVSQVSSELKKASLLRIPKDLFGIEDHVKDVKQLLQLGKSDVRVIGIWGMGGIGKTTLAKVVYDQILDGFDCCSFTAGIREISRSKGLKYVQSSLVADLLRCERPSFDDVGEGMRVLEGIYQRKKVLLLLDDIDDTKDLDALVGKHHSFGIGSRIMITTRNRAVLEKVDSIYEATLMNQDAALKLFCKRAFGEDTPVDELCDLSRDIVSEIGGLPLAIEVVGSYLYGKSNISIWIEMLNKLRRGSSGGIHNMLRKDIFEPLDHEEKQIFLDIACFFVGEDVRNVSPIWKDNFPGISYDVLVSKSIIKIGDDHKIWMHDQIRDLGRQLGKHSRLWCSKEAKDVLENRMGTPNIEGIRIHLNEEQCSLTSEHFRNLSGLRFLDLDHHVHLVGGDFENLLPSLQWLRWTDYPFNSLVNLRMPNLVSLELERNNLRDDLASSIKMMKLKVLNLRSSWNLKRTPDFSMFPHLERLILSHCSQLTMIDSISELKSLTFLDISFCSSIEELPGNFGCLEKLEILNAHGCNSLARIPDSIGRLSSLKDFSLDGTCIRVLPASVECLLRLERLSLRGCSALTVLPDIGCLFNLQTLDLYCCERLETLPALLGSKRSSLISLDISGCTRIQRLPSLSNLNLLKTLYANGCTKLEELEGLDQLNGLESLDISHCHSIRVLPNLSNFHMLKDLRISGCRQLNELLRLVQPHALRELNISSCTEIKMMPDLSKFEQLEALYAHGCGKLQELMGLDELKALKILRVSECKEIEYLPAVSKLKQLKELCVDGCQKLQDLVGLDRLESLEILRISHCKEIIELPDLSMLKQLKELDATSCEKLRHLDGLGEVKALLRLTISGCKEMEMLPDLSKLNRLQEFYASECVNLRQLTGLGSLKELRTLDVSGSEKLEDWLKRIDPKELQGVPYFEQKQMMN